MLVALYLLMVGSFSPDEVAMAVALGLLGAAWAQGADRAASSPLRFPRRTARYAAVAALRLFPRTLQAAGRLLGALRTGRIGEVRLRPFHRGQLHAPEDAGRRAAVVLALSLAPDSVVLRAPLTDDVLEVHAFGVGPDRGDGDWPA
ncbi:MAG: Na+/H+ antiporter subunit E [Caulobacteraceae bacterium]|nr:Na+/H+ antiporter subunit E [Caulobacter sp.]